MKNIISIVLLLPLVFALAVCGSTDPGPHTDPAFLVGEWKAEGKATFTIDEDLNFLCDLVDITFPKEEGIITPAQASGRLDAEDSNLGPNEYQLLDLAWTDDPINDPVKEDVRSDLTPYQSLVCTLKPNASKTQFTFTTKVITAGIFFGGTYTKVE